MGHLCLTAQSVTFGPRMNTLVLVEYLVGTAVCSDSSACLTNSTNFRRIGHEKTFKPTNFLLWTLTHCRPTLTLRIQYICIIHKPTFE